MPLHARKPDDYQQSVTHYLSLVKSWDPVRRCERRTQQRVVRSLEAALDGIDDAATQWIHRNPRRKIRRNISIWPR